MQRGDLSCHPAIRGTVPVSEVRARPARLLCGPTGAHERKRCRRPKFPPASTCLRPTNRRRREARRASTGARPPSTARAAWCPKERSRSAPASRSPASPTYGFQILAFRGLSKPDYAALNALWVFVFVLAPGVFLPLEQEVGRAVAARQRARGRRRSGRCAAPGCSAACSRSCSRSAIVVLVGDDRHRAAQVQRPRRPGRVPRRRAVHVRHRVPGARRVRGRRPVRRVRVEPRGRRRDPAAAVHPARDRQRHEPALVRAVPRGAAAARDRHRDVRADGA